MYGSVQPTGSKNPDTLRTDSVKDQSVGRFNEWVVVEKDAVHSEGLPEKVRSGISLGRSIGRAWRVVKEGVGTFFQRFFGKNSKASTGLSGVGVSAVSAKNGESQPPSNMTASGNVPRVSPKQTLSQAPASKKEKRQGISGGSSQSTSISSNSLGTLPNVSKVSNKTVHEISSTKSTASVKKSVLSSSPQYSLVDVPGDGNCGLYAVLVGMRSINPSEFGKPTHPDQGPHPLANAVQEQKVGELRKKSAEIAHKALGSRYSLEELKNMNEKKLSNKEKKIKNLLEMGSSVSEDNMKFVTEAIQKPIMVHVFQGNFCSKTLFEVGKDGQYWDNVYGNEVYPEIKASEDTIHLYLSNGHYQLMSPIKAP